MSQTKLQACYSRLQNWAIEIIAGNEELKELLEPFLQTKNVALFLIVFKTREEIQPLISIMRSDDEDSQDAVADAIINDMLVRYKCDLENFSKYKTRMRKYLKLFSFESI